MIDLRTEVRRYLELVAVRRPALYRAACDAADAADVAFAPRLRTTGGYFYPRGYAHPTRGVLARDLLEVNPAETDAHQLATLGHELAHLLDRRLSGGEHHGLTWRRWMATLGLPARECHDYDYLTATDRRYRATCRDCGRVAETAHVPRRCGDATCGSPDVRVDPVGIERAAAQRKEDRR